MLALSIELKPDAAGYEAKAHRMEGLESDLTSAIVEAVEREVGNLPRKIRGEARARLPRTGGLGERVAQGNLPVVARRKGKRASVLIVARPNAVKDPAAINRGRVRHPVFGHSADPPIIQIVPAGWFSDPIKDDRDRLRKVIRDATRTEIGKVI